jgi:Rod binding domain-containing protein
VTTSEATPAGQALGAYARTPLKTVTARGAAITDVEAGLSGLGNTRQGLKKATQEFESLLIYQVLREMRKTVSKNPMFHGGRAEDMFESFLDMETSRQIAQTGGFGLAQMLYDQLSKVVPEDTSGGAAGSPPAAGPSAYTAQAAADAYRKSAGAAAANGGTGQ